MALRRTITVSITAEQDTLLRSRLETGRYGSVNEVMRAALRLLERDERQIFRRSRATASRDASHDEG